MNTERLADLHRKLAELHAEIAAELAGEATPAAAPAANDVRPARPQKKRGRRGGARTVSKDKLRELGLSDVDMAAADRVARTRGILPNGGQ